MKYSDLYLKNIGPQSGVSLFNGDDYIATYVSVVDCIMDLTYRFKINELEKIVDKFMDNKNVILDPPYTYRGVCSEYYEPTNKIFRYVYYGNKLSDIFEKFDYHELRAAKHSEYFSFGVQGVGIHTFNSEKMMYELLVGGNLHSISDIMFELKKTGKQIPTGLEEEFRLSDKEFFDVFISHKSVDFNYAKNVYGFLNRNNLKIFLSEYSLPALSNADYVSEIDKALEKTNNMIVIADSKEKIESGWVKYEWSSFLNEKRSGRKNGNLIVVITNNMNISDLPYALRQVEVFQQDSFNDILKYIK